MCLLILVCESVHLEHRKQCPRFVLCKRFFSLELAHLFYLILPLLIQVLPKSSWHILQYFVCFIYQYSAQCNLSYEPIKLCVITFIYCCELNCTPLTQIYTLTSACMTVFGDKIFKELIHLNEVMRMGPNPMSDFLIRKKLGHRHIQREDHMKS